ncbi:MAG TPA: hypothetical protein VNO70_04050 [Blastocatellia bacterium]|nr:hypothetical protein [Blastocatellia bacterium]
MKRILLVSSLAVVLTISLAYSSLPFGRSAAQSGTPASKAAVQTGNIAVMQGQLGPGNTTTPWQTILETIIKTSQQKDLFIDVSMEVGLYTRTLARSKNGDADGSSSTAGVEVRVLVDGAPAQPGDVVFGRRTQTLTATFQGIIEGCLSVDPNTGAVIIDPECVTPEELELILDTMNANAFSFVLDDVGTGVHTVEVQARINLAGALTGTQLGETEAKATIGKGTVAVQEVRLVKGTDITL